VLALACGGVAAPVGAQQSRSDSAAVVLDAARALRGEGRAEAARELLRFIARRYAGTPAAAEAETLLRTLPRASELGTGRTGFVLFNTLYGAFLGLAVPAAFDANDDAPYGAGLLIGVPLGFFGSRAFAKNHFRTAGQAGIASFAAIWGTWQGLAWQQVLHIGEPETCTEFGCFRSNSETAPWAAMVVGGLAGLGTGWALAANREIANGTSSLISYSSFWASWFGVALGRAANLDDDDLLVSTLLAGDAGLLLSLPASRSWRPSPSRVRLITAAGLAGGLAGFGIDLLASVDDDGTALGIAAGTSALGLILGTVATRDRDDLDQPDGLGSAALLEVRDGVRFGVPLPQPAAVRSFPRTGRSRLLPAAKVNLISVTF
jgi:hypothetical protein